MPTVILIKKFVKACHKQLAYYMQVKRGVILLSGAKVQSPCISLALAWIECNEPRPDLAIPQFAAVQQPKQDITVNLATIPGLF
jgi:hypothetical protein